MARVPPPRHASVPGRGRWSALAVRDAREGAGCVCSGLAPCLFHYAELSPAEQVDARARVGVSPAWRSTK
jgi:hypothetical protein